MRSFSLAQNLISLVSYAVLLLRFSPWAVLLLALAGLPGFIAETRFSNQAFQLFRWRSTERRQQAYLETVVAREDHAKEVKLYGLGRRFLDRYKAIHRALFAQERQLAIRRDSWGFALGLLATAALYGGYCWVAVTAVRGGISIGQMTMYLLLFRQGQAAVSAALGAISGPVRGQSLSLHALRISRHAGATCRWQCDQRPGSCGRAAAGKCQLHLSGTTQPALADISLHLSPGRTIALVGSNGSGKTTLIKLITRLYMPTAGRILLDGRDLAEWDVEVLRGRFGVIFQDFVRYQMLVGENIGAGTRPTSRKRHAGARRHGLARLTK